VSPFFYHSSFVIRDRGTLLFNLSAIARSSSFCGGLTGSMSRKFRAEENGFAGDI
jgi:hypothetical protein